MDEEDSEREEHVIPANKTHIRWSEKADKQRSLQKGKEKAEASQQQASRELAKRHARDYDSSMSKNKQTMQGLWSCKPHVSAQVSVISIYRQVQHIYLFTLAWKL